VSLIHRFHLEGVEDGEMVQTVFKAHNFPAITALVMEAVEVVLQPQALRPEQVVQEPAD
jgi:hypothetical protein